AFASESNPVWFVFVKRAAERGIFPYVMPLRWLRAIEKTISALLSRKIQFFEQYASRAKGLGPNAPVAALGNGLVYNRLQHGESLI
ncbi:hypothetical protein ACC709_36630, partial [Rhizobium ruizarguesonis]